jgi:hypothetical protein
VASVYGGGIDGKCREKEPTGAEANTVSEMSFGNQRRTYLLYDPQDPADRRRGTDNKLIAIVAYSQKQFPIFADIVPQAGHNDRSWVGLGRLIYVSWRGPRVPARQKTVE